MPEESIPVDLEADQEALEEVLGDDEAPRPNGTADATTSDALAARAKARKRKTKKTKIQKTVEGSSQNGEGSSTMDRAVGANQMPADILKEMLEANPSLKDEVATLKDRTSEELIQLFNLSNLMGGTVRCSWGF